MDKTQIAQELNVSTKTIDRVFAKYERKTGQVVRHAPDKSDSRRKIYDMQDVNAALDFSGYPSIAIVVDPLQSSVEVLPPNRFCGGGEVDLLQPSAPVSYSQSDLERLVAQSSQAMRRRTQEFRNLETLFNMATADRAAMRLAENFAYVDAIAANSLNGVGAHAMGVVDGDEGEG